MLKKVTVSKHGIWQNGQDSAPWLRELRGVSGVNLHLNLHSYNPVSWKEVQAMSKADRLCHKGPLVNSSGYHYWELSVKELSSYISIETGGGTHEYKLQKTKNLSSIVK